MVYIFSTAVNDRRFPGTCEVMYECRGAGRFFLRHRGAVVAEIFCDNSIKMLRERRIPENAKILRTAWPY